MPTDTLDAKSLGLTFSALRKIVGLTQTQLAKRAKVSLSTYSRHESGREAPSARLTAAYARELGYLYSEFLRIHEELHRSRRRVEMGPNWWRNVSEEAQVDNIQALEARKAVQDIEAAAAVLVERLRQTLNRT